MEYYGENNVQQWIFQLETPNDWKIGFEPVGRYDDCHRDTKPTTVARVGDRIIFEPNICRIITKEGTWAYEDTAKPITTHENPDTVLLMLNAQDDMFVFNYWTGALIHTEVLPATSIRSLISKGFKSITAPRPMFHISELYKPRLHWMMFPQRMTNINYSLKLDMEQKSLTVSVPFTYYFEFESFDQHISFKVGRLTLNFFSGTYGPWNKAESYVSVERENEETQVFNTRGRRWGLYYTDGILTVYQTTIFKQVLQLEAEHSHLSIRGTSPLILVHPTFQYPASLQYGANECCIYQDCCRTLRTRCGVFGNAGETYLYPGCFCEVKVSLNSGDDIVKTIKDQAIMYQSMDGSVVLRGYEVDPVFNRVETMGFYRDEHSWIWIYDVGRNVLLGRCYVDDLVDERRTSEPMVIPGAVKPITSNLVCQLSQKKRTRLSEVYGADDIMEPRIKTSTANSTIIHMGYLHVDPQDEGQMIDVDVEYRPNRSGTDKAMRVYGLVHLEPFEGAICFNVRGCQDFYVGVTNTKNGRTKGRLISMCHFYDSWEHEKSISIICKDEFTFVVDTYASNLYTIVGTQVSVGYLDKPRNMLGIYGTIVRF